MRSRRQVRIVASLTMLFALSGWARGTAAERFVVFPESGHTFAFLRNGGGYLELNFGGWGPGWSWLGMRSKVSEAGGRTRSVSTTKVDTGADLTLTADVEKTGPRQVRFDVELTSSKDTDLTAFIAGLSPQSKRFENGKVLVTMSDGKKKTVTMPVRRKGLGRGVKQFVLVDGRGDETTVTLDPPLDVPTDGDLRITLAESLAAGRPVRASITVDLPADASYYADARSVPQDPGFDEWYTFRPTNNPAKPSEIGMTDWLERPAGKHGRITRQGGDLLYNGRPIKLWGLNVCYSSCAPEQELAERRAAFYAKFGVNSVRLHKWADGPGWAGIQSAESAAEFDPEGLDRMDYFIAKLKEVGIFVKLSAQFGTVRLGPGDVRDVPYAEEFGSFGGRKNRIDTPHSSFPHSPEIQNVHIRQIRNLLEHKNPYTGLTYAEDPAVFALEIVNEQSAMFFTAMNPLKASPTLRKTTGRRFCEWLRRKYGSHDGLVDSWGENALDSFADEGFPSDGEHLDKNNILPLGNPWYWDPDNLDGAQQYRRRRLLDSLEFLYVIQCEAYDRWVAAVRRADYDGEILASNWQAGRQMSHYYNLHSDYRIGLIDRHNYFGGGSGAKINNSTMLRVPGSGMLSAGMQQVDDRPFMLSEWIHVAPNEWGVEGPAIIGAYGLGLQDWDVSYMFQNRDSGGFNDQLDKDRWNVTAPQVIGVFPAVARQVLRGDVKPAQVEAIRYVHVPSLAEGRLGFDDRMVQQYDVKAFDCDKVPARSLAVARCAVQFVDEPTPTPQFDLAKYVHNGTYISSTGQLKWTAGRTKLDGHFTIDTAATKAVVGFAEGETCMLGDVTIAPQSRFAAIYVAARAKDAELATARNILVVAIGRARNSGMKIYDDVRLLHRGGPPVVMEPVRATIRLGRPGTPTVHVLDHDGCQTGRTLPVTEGEIKIDGVRDKTCYYLLEY